MINKTKFLILFLLTFVFIGFTSCTQGTQNPDDNDDDQPVHIVTNLDTPTELKVEIDDQYVTVSFEKVANAIMYEIVFENVTTNTTIKEKISPEYNSLVRKISFFTPGSYSVKVRANGDDGETYFNSAYSQKILFTIQPDEVTPDPLIILDAPTNVAIKTEDDIITVSFKEVANASSYKIIIKDSSGNVTSTLSATKNSLKVNVSTLIEGDYTVVVIAVGDEVKYTSSEESEAATFTVKSGNPDLGGNGDGDGDNTDTPSDLMSYYKQAEGLIGSALKAKLRIIISSTHKKVTTYAECKTYLQNADEDPNNSSNMLLYYTGKSVTKTDNMNIWNREHVWAQSLGWFKTSGAGADLHHIRPCEVSVNSSRGNKKFGTASSYYNPLNINGSGQDYRGDTARIIFYLFTRYSESDSYGFTAIAQSLDILLEWNKIDPVTPHEQHRNEYIFKIQGNRNPFIDYPEFADYIWK